MAIHASPILHRDDPDKDPLIGHVKVTRLDWLNMAREVLVTEGVGEVKILGLARRMGVSRSSFYWYFKDRSDILVALLEEWETRNTLQIVQKCEMSSANITEAVCNFFQCFIGTSTFDQGLDFAIREWSRRDPEIRKLVDVADHSRIYALTQSFSNHGFDIQDADARARILYFMQLGYHALEVSEDKETRLSRLEPYIRGFTGTEPDPDAVDAFLNYIEQT